MNPRATKSPPGLDAVRTKRIIRQGPSIHRLIVWSLLIGQNCIGIPYGPEVHENEKDAALTLYDRGLLFVSSFLGPIVNVNMYCLIGVLSKCTLRRLPNRRYPIRVPLPPAM